MPDLYFMETCLLRNKSAAKKRNGTGALLSVAPRKNMKRHHKGVLGF